MGLSSLNSALSGLSIAQRQIDVISNNVSNSGTEGYTRKILPQSTQAIAGKSVGVLAGTITRNVDLNLSRTLWTQTSAVSFNDIQVEYLNKISQFHGPPDREVSVAAQISKLEDGFSLLSDNPSDPFIQAATVDEAVDTANKINNFSEYITDLRNDAQNEIADTVRQINDLLEQIANINVEIQRSLAAGGTTANAQDVRDQALKTLSGLVDTSFFVRGDGVMVVQTNEGAEMTGTVANPLTFRPSTLSATIAYPETAAGVFIGDPNVVGEFSLDITASDPGGKLGGLIELRDETFPKQMAQLDELAHKMTLRFEAQGLRLFTDNAGSIPLDTEPDFSTDPATPVEYVGFSALIRVNEAIIADNTLLQTGTSGATIQAGSNEVISRILEHTFGSVEYQQAVGTINLEDLDTYVNDTLQPFLGIFSAAETTGTRDLSPFVDAAAFVAATNGDINGPANSFRITIEEPDLGLGPIDIDIDITAVPALNGDFAQDLVDEINAQIALLPAGDQTALTTMSFVPTVSTNGELSLTSSANITIDSNAPANPLGDANLALLGLRSGTQEAEDPYFDIAVGKNDFTRITIGPLDDEGSLLAKLQAIPGLAAQFGPTGELELRPGNDPLNPEFGGELRVISGSFSASGAGANADIAAGTIPDGVNIVSALFGSFITGTSPQNISPVTDVLYGSQVSDTDVSGLAFREDFLGQNGIISTGVLASRSITDFAQKMVNEHTQELILLEERVEDDSTFRDLLSDQLLRESGVNLDEELANLIVVQTAYSASARVLNAIDDLFQELLNTLL